jgi:DNA-binding beta-propeller fold protein YncE
VFVTNEELNRVQAVDPVTLQLSFSFATGAGPYGIVADGPNVLWIACSDANRVEVWEVSPEPRLLASVPTEKRPKGLALDTRTNRLYVTHFLNGHISVINTQNVEVAGTLTTGRDSNFAQNIRMHPTNGRLYMPHIRSNSRVLATPLFDSAVFPLLTAVDPAGTAPLQRIDLSQGLVASNLPFDVAFSPDGRRAYTVHLGSADLAEIPLDAPSRLRRLQVGDGPRGVTVSPDGTTAWVFNSHSEDVSVVDLAGWRETRRISLTPANVSETVKLGKRLFFSSLPPMSRNQWMSCASCHLEGGHDGRVWNTPAGPRNTIGLRGVADYGPAMHWSADIDEVQDAEFTIRTTQGGDGLIRGRMPNIPLGRPNRGLSAELDALAEYVFSLRAKSNPEMRSEEDPDAIERGRVVFERPDTRCALCHPAPTYTDSSLRPPRKHDVGTGEGDRSGPFFDTPTLRGIWDSEPYLHDGRAATLLDVLTVHNAGDRHGQTSQLSESELQDLIRFLRSL